MSQQVAPLRGAFFIDGLSLCKPMLVVKTHFCYVVCISLFSQFARIVYPESRHQEVANMQVVSQPIGFSADKSIYSSGFVKGPCHGVNTLFGRGTKHTYTY